MIGLRVKYKELFSLAIEQDFYRNGVCRSYTTGPFPDLTLTPSAESEILMKRMDIIYRNIDHSAGLVALARVSGSTLSGDDILRFKAGSGDKLIFYSMLRNADLVSFNDLPVNADVDRLYYFTNEQADVLAPRNDLHITNAATGVDGFMDTLRRLGPDYRYQHSSPVNSGTAFVKHITSGIHAEPASIINHGGVSDLLFDLSQRPSGKYELVINAVVEDVFYFLRDAPASPVFAVMEVMLSQALISNYRVVEEDQSLTPARPAYTIKFRKRKTLWRYNILLPENSPLATKLAAMTNAEKATYLSNLKIETNDTTITFSQESATDTVIVFVSDNRIALQEKYTSSTTVTPEPLIITLKENTGLANEAVVKANLPYPSAGSIDARNLPDIFSDILITL